MHCHKLGHFRKVCQGKPGSKRTTSGALSHHVSTNTVLSYATMMLHYLYPQARSTTTTANQLTVKAATTDKPQQHTMDRIMEKFLAVFDGQIRMMERKEFHILVAGAVFCVKTPQSVPFAYREKIILELKLLQEQGIIMPVIEVTEWCAPIMLTPKRIQI